MLKAITPVGPLIQSVQIPSVTNKMYFLDIINQK